MTGLNRIENAYLHTFAPESAYGANVNVLPGIREAIKTAFPDLYWNNREADVCAVSIKAASAFTVELNRGTEIAAQYDGIGYTAAYVGFIDYIVFSASTTPTAVSVYWNQHDQTHKTVSLNAPAGATISLTDDFGYTIYPTADGKYELRKGWYTLTMGSTVNRFFYDFGETVNHLDFTQAVITLGADLTYTGSEQTKGVTVTYGGATLTANTDYIVTGNKGTNAGSYEMTITGIAAYQGEHTRAWNIAKATPALTISPESFSVVVGASAEIAITTDSDGVLSAASASEEIATATLANTTVTVTGVAAGDVNVTVSQAASDNYNAATDAVCAVTVTSE